MIGGEPEYKFWLRWVGANAAGELVGLGGVFAVGVLLSEQLGEPKGVLMLAGWAALVIALAAFEGAAVGLAQWLVLRRALPGLSWRPWVLATIAGAVAAWILGMIPNLAAPGGEGSATPPVEPPLAVLMGLAAAMGAVLGAILAAPQWWVLRRYVRRTPLWLAANALAWAAAMPLIFWLVSVTVAENQTLPAAALLAGGVGAAGALVGGVHGVILVRLLSSRHAANPPPPSNPV